MRNTIDGSGLVGKPFTVHHARLKQTVINNADACEIRDGALLFSLRGTCVVVFGPGEWRSVNASPIN